LSRPSLPLGLAGNIAAATRIDCEEMAAEQKRCTETQSLLTGTFLTFKQADIHRLVSIVSTDVFHLVVPTKFQKDFFSFICTISA
jgi:hypothetical protein